MYGQLGHGDDFDVKEPKMVNHLIDDGTGNGVFIEAIGCGANFSAALAEDGKVYTWGCGDHGSLGHNDTKDQMRPKPVQDLFGTDITRIACGDSHMFACTERETYGWGWNGCGQLGISHTEDQHRPHVVENLRGNLVESIACGSAHSVAVVNLAKLNQVIVYSWGSNSTGQLGQGKQKKSVNPNSSRQIGQRANCRSSSWSSSHYC